jgi:alpha-galactosidase
MNRLLKRLLVSGFAINILFFTLSINAQVSQMPPMGWNSYDCFNFTATESEVKANADYMAANLKQYGWQYICIDWAWYYTGTGTGSPNQDSNFSPALNLDSNGRMLPDTTRFPSSTNGQGFKPLADYIHGKGLKIGVHLMRGIPRQAVNANVAILGTSYHANDIADKANLCSWLNLMYGLNMSNPGSQAYLNSLFQLYASWGIDFVKVDDLINPYGSPNYRQSEIEGYRNAINNCGREMVFSTSPGATPLANASHIMQWANQWRMANDLWDNWGNLNTMFDLASSWNPYAGAGHWPDADMIPIGKLSKRGPNGSERYSNLTSDEKYTMMTLWCIARSPLIWGGNLVENRAEELQLMQNSEVIAVNQNSANSKPIVTGNTPLWCADVPGTSDKYVAIFNRNSGSSNVTITFGNIGISGSATIRDLWAKNDIGTYSNNYSISLAAHQSRLFKISAVSQTPATTAEPTPEQTQSPTTAPNPNPIWSGGPYTLDGTSASYVDLPDGLMSSVGDFSVAAWVKLSSSDNWARIFDFGTDTNVYMMLTPKSGTTGYPYFAITTSGNAGEQGLNGTSAVATGSWRHIAVTKSGVTGILYIDKQEVARNTSMTLNPSDLGNTANNYIGKSQWSADPYLSAHVDKFVVYNRALSASEVTTLGSTPPDGNNTLGDVNGNGTVDIIDALLVAQYYVGLSPSGFVAANADVNCSGSIDIVDALLVAQYYVGLISNFAC